MKNYTLYSFDRQASKEFVRKVKVVKGLKAGQYSRLKVTAANGSVDYYPNANEVEEKNNLAQINSRKEKQAKDAVKHKKLFKNKFEKSKAFSNFMMGFAIIIDVIAGISIIAEPIRELLISGTGLENAVALVACASVLISFGAIASKAVSAHRKGVLTEIEDYELYFQNESLIESQQKNRINQRGLPLNDRMVINKRGLSAANLDELTSLGFRTLLKNINQTISCNISIAKGEKPVYSEDTLGNIPILEEVEEDDDEDELKEEPLVYGYKPKKPFRLFGLGKKKRE
jgi:hypothetical protein